MAKDAFDKASDAASGFLEEHPVIDTLTSHGPTAPLKNAVQALAPGGETWDFGPAGMVYDALSGGNQLGADAVDPATGLPPAQPRTVGDQIESNVIMGGGLVNENAAKGKAGKPPTSTFEAEGSPAPPPELLRMQQAIGGRLADYRQLDYTARAATMGVIADINADLGDQTEAQYETAMVKMGELLNQAEAEIAAVDDLIDAAKSNRINPGQFFANVGEAGSFAAALAIGAGSMASAFGGGPNLAHQIISAAIDRNVRAQVVNQAHDRALISHQLNFVNSIRGLAKDQGSYANLVRIGLYAVAQARIAEASAGYGEVQNHIAAQTVHDMLGANLVQARINQYASTKYKFKAAYQGWRQGAQAARATIAALESVTGAPTAAGQPGPQRPRRSRGTPPSATGGPRVTGGQTAGTKNQELVDQVIQKAMQNEGFAQMDPKSQARLIADTMQTEASNANAKVSTQMKDALVSAFGDGQQDNLSREIKSLPDIEFANDSQNQKVPTFIPGIGARNFQVQNQAVWDKAKQPEVLEKMGIGMRAVAYTKRLAELAAVINMGKNLKNIARKDANGQWIIPVGNQSMTETELMSEINGIVEVLVADALALEPGRNALNRMWEVKRLEAKTGSRPSGLLELGDLFGGVLPEVRVARIKPFIQLRDNEVRALATANGLYIPGNESAVLPDLDAVE